MEKYIMLSILKYNVCERQNTEKNNVRSNLSGRNCSWTAMNRFYLKEYRDLVLNGRYSG